jgi:hypothetical protein
MAITDDAFLKAYKLFTTHIQFSFVIANWEQNLNEIGSKSLQRNGRSSDGSSHRRDEMLHHGVVDVCQRDVANIRIQPVIQTILPRAESCWLNWLSFAGRLLSHEQLGLLLKRNANGGFNELTSIVDAAGHNNLKSLCLSFSSSQTSRTSNRTNTLGSVNPLFLAGISFQNQTTYHFPLLSIEPT